MLRFLRIEHLAVIDAVQVDFDPGLNVLTGETGAGKSMLVEAVGLLMGGRAAADLIRTGESQASVQAVFEIGGLTPLAELIVRRDVNAQGRSRAFVNDALVTAAALDDRTSPLVELHGQHEHQTLLDPQSHLLMLDEFAGPGAVARRGRRRRFDTGSSCSPSSTHFRWTSARKPARLDLLKFQVGELEKAKLRSGEDEELETTRRVLSSADKLQRLCSEAYAALYDSDEAALARLAPSGNEWRSSRMSIPSFCLTSKRATRSSRSSRISRSRCGPTARTSTRRRRACRKSKTGWRSRAAQAEARSRRSPMSSQKRNALARQLDALQNADERRAGPRSRDAGGATRAFLTRARALSRDRREGVARFCSPDSAASRRSRDGADASSKYGSNAMCQRPSWTESGIDIAECYLSANVGEEPRPLARIASGGELSRVMLAIRTLAAADAPGKTLIFDEIDAGIGGRVADVVGKKLRRHRRDVPGALHHAPSANRRGRPRAFPDFESRSPTAARRRASFV